MQYQRKKKRKEKKGLKSNMQLIIEYIKKRLWITSPTKLMFPKKQLGRWNVEYCERMNRKIDWANHDNCGPCVIPVRPHHQNIHHHQKHI